MKIFGNDFFKNKIIARTEIGENGCWNWKGHFVKGIPQIKIGTKNYTAKRLSFECYLGEPGESFIHVKSSCGNEVCVNPEHLMLKNLTWTPRRKKDD